MTKLIYETLTNPEDTTIGVDVNVPISIIFTEDQVKHLDLITPGYLQHGILLPDMVDHKKRGPLRFDKCIG